jgi:hypothetical protein
MLYRCPGFKGQGISKAEAMAGISDNFVVKVSRCFQAVREGDVFLRDRRFPVDNRRRPPRHPTIQRLLNSQNVAGLWLKYGVKSLKIEGSAARKILWGDATIC